MMSNLPQSTVGVMDRGFAGLPFINQLSKEKKYFVLRIKNNWKLEFAEETELIRVGTGKNSGLHRVISFCDLETKTEYRLVPNLPSQGEVLVSNEEIMEISRCRWSVISGSNVS